MTIDQGFAQVRTWLVRVIGIAFLVLIAALLLSRFGVVLPVSLPSPEWMAYLGGAFWLVR